MGYGGYRFRRNVINATMVVLRASFQLHNQIEDTKGQARTFARVRPMDAQEKEAGCKEVIMVKSHFRRVGGLG